MTWSLRACTAIVAGALVAVSLSGCVQDPAAEGAEASGDASVQACADGAGSELVRPAADRSAATIDPATLEGPRTAVVRDDHVRPVSVAAAPNLPVIVESCDGETVVVDDVSRILAVDLNGSLADLVFGLGMGDHVVGRDRSTNFPEAAELPMVTPSAHDLSAEAILALDPTVVLTDTSIGPPEVLEQLRDVGIAVVYFDDDVDLTHLASRVRAVAQVLGVPEAGEDLVDRITAQMVTAVAAVPTADPAPRVAFLYVRGSAGVYLLAGPGSGADELIEYVGGIDVGTEIGLDQPFTPLTSEAMIEAAPDVILVMTDGLSSVGGVDKLLAMPGIEQTPAADRRRVIDMSDDALLSFGTRSPQVVEALALALYSADAP